MISFIPKQKIFLSLMILLFVIVVIGVLGLLAKPGLVQPLDFNHKKHKEQGLECRDCHQYVENFKFAGMPNIEVCSNCHSAELSESQEEKKLLEFLQKGERIPWKRIYQEPDHVFYSHRKHVSLAKIECEICHGEIGEMEKLPEKPLKKLSMKFCLDCHRQKNATTDCLDCHI